MTQPPLPPLVDPDQRSKTRDRWFKRGIVLTTLVCTGAMIAAFPLGRFYAIEGVRTVRIFVVRSITGLEPSRADVKTSLARQRALAVANTTRVLQKFYDGTNEPMRKLFQVAGMAPGVGLIGSGRVDQTFLFSSQVFEADPHGRSYRLRPNVRSIWLRQITLHQGPFGLLQVLDDPTHHDAATNAGGIVEAKSKTTTNSWGLRGPEPDPSAPLRGVILGDSFMQGMLIGDDQTPPVHLAEKLSRRTGQTVSLANTGHVGYSPEQEYYSLLEYGDRMKPHFVVLSIHPNDLDDEAEVFQGRPKWLAEAGYWIEQIQNWCRVRRTICLLVPVPTYQQIENYRKDGYYPGLVNNLFKATPGDYCDPLERFLDEYLRLRREARLAGKASVRSWLHNREIDDDHFSPRGAALWAEIVADRLFLLLPPSNAEASEGRPAAAQITSQPSAPEPRR